MSMRAIESSTGSRVVFDVWPGGDHWTLLVHGLSSNAKTWWQVAERLNAAGRSVITVDQRSHGRSDVAHDGYGWATLAADLIAVLDAAGAAAALTAGQSWGAGVVLETAARHPDRISAAVSVDGAYVALKSRFDDWETCEAALRPAEIPPVTREVMGRYIRDAHPSWTDAGIEATLGNFRDVNGLLERALPIPHHMEIVRNLWEHDPVPVYGAIDQPTGVITAAPSTDHVEVAADQIVALPGDHDLHVEQPDAIADLILEWGAEWGV